MTWNYSEGIRAVVLSCPPYTFLDFPGKEPVAGPIFQQFHEIMIALNISMKVDPLKHGLWGHPNASGHWSGVVGSLQRKEADVAIFVGPTSSRDEIVIFSAENFHNNVVIMGGIPPVSTTTDVLRLALVFEKEVWIFLFVCMLFMVFVSSLRVHNQTKYVNGLKSSKTAMAFIGKQDFVSLFSCYVSTLFMEGTPRNPTTSVGCFLFSLWLLAMLILANAFCGLMRATMMAPPRQEKIHDLSHLSTVLHKILPVVMSGTAVQEFLTEGLSEEKKRVWQATLKGGGLQTPKQAYSSEMVAKIAQGRAAILSGEVLLRFNIGRICRSMDVNNLYIAHGTLFPYYGAIAFGKDFNRDLLKVINQRIRMYTEGYITQKWIEKELGNKDSCFSLGAQQEVENPLGIDDVSSIFYLYLTCSAITFLIVCAEALTNRLLSMFTRYM